MTPLDLLVGAYALMTIANSAVCALPYPRNPYSFYAFLYHFAHGLVSIASEQFEKKFHVEAPEVTPGEEAFTDKPAA